MESAMHAATQGVFIAGDVSRRVILHTHQELGKHKACSSQVAFSAFKFAALVLRLSKLSKQARCTIC